MTRYLSLLILAVVPACATTLFTDPNNFLAAVTGTPVVQNFDQPPLGTPVPSGSSLAGMNFTYSIGGLNLKIVNDFNTVSGTQSLGIDNPGNFNQFVAGDSFSMTFATPLQALGLYLITTADPIFAGDFSLVTPAGSVLNSATPWMALPDTGTVYFLGLISDHPFSTASLQFDAGATGAFLFNVDDVITAQDAPEPLTYLLCGVGLIFASLKKRGRPWARVNQNKERPIPATSSRKTRPP